MQKIASFTIDHDVLVPGLYVSRVDGDVVTYDLRMRVPNRGDYLSTGAAHTLEHLFATYVRNSAYSPQVVYVGPMGCRTGFYFLTRDQMTRGEVLNRLPSLRPMRGKCLAQSRRSAATTWTMTCGRQRRKLQPTKRCLTA